MCFFWRGMIIKVIILLKGYFWIFVEDEGFWEKDCILLGKLTLIMHDSDWGVFSGWKSNIFWKIWSTMLDYLTVFFNFFWNFYFLAIKNGFGNFCRFFRVSGMWRENGFQDCFKTLQHFRFNPKISTQVSDLKSPSNSTFSDFKFPPQNPSETPQTPKTKQKIQSTKITPKKKSHQREKKPQKKHNHFKKIIKKEKSENSHIEWN